MPNLSKFIAKFKHPPKAGEGFITKICSLMLQILDKTLQTKTAPLE